MMSEKMTNEIRDKVTQMSTDYLVNLIKLCDENMVDRDQLIKSTIEMLKEYVDKTDLNSK